MATESRARVVLALIASGIIAVVRLMAAAVSGSPAPGATRIFVDLEAPQ